MSDECPECGGELKRAYHAYPYIGTDLTYDLFARCLNCGRYWVCTNSVGPFPSVSDSAVLEVRKMLDLSDDEVGKLNTGEWETHKHEKRSEFKSQVERIDREKDEQRREHMTDEEWERHCERKRE